MTQIRTIKPTHIGLVLLGSTLMACGWEPLAPPVVTLEINPPVASLSSCADQTFQVRAFNGYDSPVPATIAWSVSDSSKASIDQTGRLSPKESGTINVIASAQNKRVEASVTITKDTTVVGVGLLPNQTVIDNGAKTTFKAAGVNKCDQILEAVSETYSFSANPADGSFNGTEFTAKHSGVIDISGKSSSGKEASGTVLVRASAASKTSDRQTTIDAPRAIPTPIAEIPKLRSYFLEYVPSDFGRDPNKRYPLMIVFPGAGTPNPIKSEDGLVAEQLANNASDPSLTAMIVLTPFFPENATDTGATLWPPERIQAIINAAKARYPVDVKRIYLAGFSFGGGGVWNFLGASKQNADQIAAAVVVAGSLRFYTKAFQTNTGAFANAPIPDVSENPGGYDFQKLGCNIEASNLPVRAVHSSGDKVVVPVVTQTVLASIDCLKTAIKPSPAPQLVQSELGTLTPLQEHSETSSKSWNPSFRPGGKNTYEWLLQFSRP
jgi:hypothetical protein